MDRSTRWTRRLIKHLRRERTLSDFGELLGTSKSTVWRWEAGEVRPHASNADRLSALAEREGFLKEWKLVGSMTLVGDVESAKAEISELFRKSAERSTRQLRGQRLPLTPLLI